MYLYHNLGILSLSPPRVQCLCPSCHTCDADGLRTHPVGEHLGECRGQSSAPHRSLMRFTWKNRV